ncbi:Hypothetical predicted protein [Podarcis lilfordi]|uniref:Uncharacterized protein n=1 Tax=Podarcis lilfordi TaxID=74358 RepID=A0AA35KVK7_9SAUR|nr:Hypothetical predicted protein [Podarcis lilfordi]
MGRDAPSKSPALKGPSRTGGAPAAKSSEGQDHHQNGQIQTQPEPEPNSPKEAKGQPSEWIWKEAGKATWEEERKGERSSQKRERKKTLNDSLSCVLCP